MIADQKDFITPHITDSHTLDYPCFTSAGHWYQRLIPQACEYDLPRWNPIHIGRFALDISPTRHVVMLWIAASLCVVTTLVALRAHNRRTREGKAPSGFGNGLEALVLYLRNEVVLPNVGPHGNAFVPYLLTLFFFILFANLLGLVPYGATATGNISVTATLAIRLFANMISGHVVLLALISLIFTFATWILVPVPVALALGISLLELFVAFLQAFIFTLLSSVFIGLIREGAH